jgi:DNA-binding transcriptional MerR regulator
MLKPPYSRSDLNKIFPDTPSRTLRSWIDAGMVEWAGEARDGRGVHRLFDDWNLYQIGIVIRLASLHFPLSFIKTLMEDNFMGKEHGKPRIVNKIEKVLIIAIRGKDLSDPAYSTELCSEEDMTSKLKDIFDKFRPYYKADGEPVLLERRGPIPISPSTIIIINLPDIADRVRYLIETAIEKNGKKN